MSHLFDPRLTAYFGDATLSAGFLPTPHLFLRHYVELGLDSTLAMFVLQLMETTWDLGATPRTSRDFAERMGVGTKAIQRYTNRLEALGLVSVIAQFDATGAQVENRYDLSPLFQRLTALVADRSCSQQRRKQPRRPPEARHQSAAPADQPDVEPFGAACSGEPRSNQHRAERQTRPGPGDRSIAGGTDQAIPGPRIDRSSLKESLRINNKQQEPAMHDASALRGKDDQARSQKAQPSAWSIRQQRPLLPNEVAASHALLTRMAIDNPVRARIAQGVAPEDLWALRVYSAAKGWSPALTVTQVYEKHRKQVQIAPDLEAEHYELGTLLAELAHDTAEGIFEAVLQSCPHKPQGLALAPVLESSAPALMEVTERLWHVVARLRGYPQAGLSLSVPDDLPVAHQGAVPANATPIWQTALRDLQQRIPGTEFVTWLESSVMLDLEEHADRAHVVIGVSNIFARDHVMTTYLPLIEDMLTKLLGKPARAQVELAATQVAAPIPHRSMPSAAAPTVRAARQPFASL